MRIEDSGGTPVINRPVPRPAHRGPEPARLPLSEPGPAGQLPLDLVRRDIAGDRPGVPLMLRVRVLHAVSGFPVTAAVVDLRHREPSGNGELRGAQVTDTDGYAEFRTVHPGREPGTAVRIDATVHVGGILAGGRAVTYAGPLFIPEQIAEQIVDSPGPTAPIGPDHPTSRISPERRASPFSAASSCLPASPSPATPASPCSPVSSAHRPSLSPASRAAAAHADLDPSHFASPAGGMLTVVPRDRFDLTAGLLATVTVTVGD